MESETVDRIKAGAAAAPVLAMDAATVWEAIGVRRQRRRRLAVGGGLAAIALAGAGVVAWPPNLDGWPAAGRSDVAATQTSVVGQTPSPTCTTRECLTGGEFEGIFRQQDAMVPFLAQLHAIGDADPGFGGITVSFDPPAIDLAWHGSVPDEALGILEEAEAAGLGTTVTQTPYGLMELEQAAANLAGAIERIGVDGVLSVGPAEGNAGVAVGVEGGTPDAGTQSQVLDLAEALLGEMPVVFIDAEQGWLTTPQGSAGS